MSLAHRNPRRLVAREDVLYVSLLLLLTALAFSDVIGPGRTLEFGDHYLAFKPRWWWVVQSVGAGELPARTYGSAAGVPLETILNGTYTPLASILFAGDFDVTYDLFVAAHVLVCCSGVYVLVRTLRGSAPVALAASLVGLTGPIVSYENLVVIMIGLAYAPWTYVALVRVARLPSAVRVAWLGLAVAFHVQGIIIEILLLDLLVVVALLFHLRPSLRAVGSAVLAGLLGWSIASIEIMPVLEALASTRRGRGFDYAEQAMWSVTAEGWWGVLAPSMWSLPEIPHAHFTDVFHGRGRSYLTSIYLGTFLPLAVSAWSPRSRWVVAAFAAACFGTLLAMGDGAPLHPLLARIPPMTTTRYPVKFLVVAVGALTLAVANRPTSAYRRDRSVFGVYAAVVLATWLLLTTESGSSHRLDELDLSTMNLVGVEVEAVVAMIDAAQRLRLLHALVFALLALAAVVTIRRPRRRLTALAVIAGVDLALAASYAICGMPVEPVPVPEIAERIGGLQSRYFMHTGVHQIPLSADLDVPLFEQEQLNRRRRGEFALRIGRQFADDDLEGQSSRMSVQAMQLIESVPKERADLVLGRLGIRWVSTSVPIPGVGVEVVEIPGQVPQYLVPIGHHRAYAEIFSDWKTTRLDAMWSRALVDHLTRGDTWDQLLVGDAAAPVPTSTACRSSVSYGEPRFGDDARLHTSASCDTMVLVQETWHPRWTATVDGGSAEVLPAELGQSAIFVPAGEHDVELVYDGLSRRWCYVSAAGLAIAAAMLAGGALRRRRRP